MSKIKVMPEELSNRIAAGEVIERPASVVKELVENAVDAGANEVRIVVEKAGERLISVTDDGSGMDADDALLALEPHGTSKIFTDADISGITTLGFRGEALPSIASISRFTLTTRTRDMLEGVRVRVEGGRLAEAAPAGCPAGTAIEVRDLFYNTPARKKFLKSPATEAHHIEEMVLALALPHHAVGFELRLDGRRVFRSPGAPTPEPRLAELFGRSFADNLWPVEHVEGDIRVRGFTAMPGFTRNSRREQRTFINHRAVESQALYRGIREGYGTLAEPGRFPPVILFIELPPEEVDVNVHPAKREVRFKREFAVTRAVAAAIGNALRRSREGDALPNRGNAPLLPSDGTVPLRLLLDGAGVNYHPNPMTQPALLPEAEEEVEPPRPAFTPEPHLRRPPRLTPTEFLTDPPPEPAPESEPVPEPEPSRFDYPEAPFSGDWPEEVLGVYDRTYILAAGRFGLVLIDQHAAHERILFEELLAAARHGAASQSLLFPETLELPLPLASLLLRNRKFFEVIGFDFEPMGSGTVLLNAAPQSLPTKRNYAELIPDMLLELLENQNSRMPVELEYVARAACRAAVKAQDELTPGEAAELLLRLKACRQGTLCPHGRPTMVTLSRKELEKRFGRR